MTRPVGSTSHALLLPSDRPFATLTVPFHSRPLSPRLVPLSPFPHYVVHSSPHSLLPFRPEDPRNEGPRVASVRSEPRNRRDEGNDERNGE